MATQALPRRRQATRRRKKPGRRWLALWPLILAAVVTPFAVKTAEILPLMGPAGLTRLRLLYPYALLAQQYLGEPRGETASQVLFYLQFPLYACLLMLLQRLKSFSVGLIVVLLLHFTAVAALWLLSI